ncbi:type VI secretion system-associated protein TagF [Sphingomonas sp.]|uniref:type VI secretion system-associated protein TagF n=1 Tax=Sphingomonas sp. TaxID=28214 RepID=UPI002DD636CD|nr:type VI secretion system-associated protein TagF [Sphingomonas sp.]
MSAAVFGKLPAHGDFVSRGLVAGERDAIDGWLSDSLSAARDALGTSFDQLWGSAPPWRFGQVRDGQGTAAAIAASVDGAGRVYPILVRRAGLASDQVASAAEACEALLFDALAGGWSADVLADAVGAIVPDAGDAWRGGALWWTEGGEDFAPASVAGERPAGLMRKVLSVDVTS